MLPILLFSALGGLLSYNLSEHDVAWVFLGAPSGLIIGLFVTAFFSRKLVRWELTSTNNLAPLDDFPRMNRYYVGCYAAGTVVYFVYIRQLADGGRAYHMLRKEKVVIYYDEKLTSGILEQHRFVPPAWSRGWLTFWQEEHVYKFRIPVGSLQEGFKF